MKKIISSMALIIASLTSQAACADTYWGLGYSSYELNLVNIYPGREADLDAAVDMNAIEGVLGINTSPNIGWEARAGFGLGKEDIYFSLDGRSGTVGPTNKLNSYLSGYIKPQIVKNNFKIYGLLGFSTVSNTLDFTSIGGGKGDTNDSGVSYGIGAGLTVSNNNSLHIEWKNLAEIDGGDIKGFTFSFQHSY